MQDIHIKIEAYGAIEKHLPAELRLSCASNSLITDVLNQIKIRYPSASDLLERCACAIGEDIMARQSRLAQDSTLVLLSPVAGG
ncbi:molybdopterin synthase sulfur carrier subunit [Acinetobacter sp. MF4642]|uniref:MoaD/ThiS family protein n=1 Tax=Acinetobacter sp. MF4642 TaxID=1960825 RepID=UPI000995D25E|nr:MoaD/ThiS family protein [Acinetobacter sp. MF4642]OOW08686.1 molybdopterin synthase sulfur carrier subunit [Acinetobacter sp. MF4642]